MPDDAAERTEPPTSRRRSEARENGQVARSPDLHAAVSLLGAVIALNVLGGRMLRDLLDAFSFYLGGHEPIALSNDQTAHLLMWTLRLVAKVCLPLVLVILILGVITEYGQVGWLLTTKPLKPKFSKLNPIAGAGRLFSARGTVRLGMSILKMMIIGAVAYTTIASRLKEILSLSAMDYWPLLGLAAELVYTLALRLALVLLVLGILDYMWNRYKLEQDLKMTKEEVKEEMRRMEGDPVVKQRQRRVQQQMALERLRGSVPKADVVVTNPTELAIALKYDPETMTAPRVVAKGAGFMAAQIRKIAIENSVPIVERKPLAQAMYRIVEVGQEIPPQFYKAVAEILAYVYELSGKSARPRRTPQAVGA